MSHLPRIVCLHGGGTNARIFRNQCRSLIAHLKDHLRFIFVDAPFPSIPGPDVETVYAEWGPFRSWVRIPLAWDSTSVDADAVDASIQKAVAEDDRNGSTGQIVGLLGFSQGAKMAACLLLRAQMQLERPRSPKADYIQYSFAVLIAGRGPLVTLDGNALPSPVPLSLPTIHVHGLHDKGLPMHQELFKECNEDSTQLIEWDGDHRVPIKSKDVVPLAAAIYEAAKRVEDID